MWTSKQSNWSLGNAIVDTVSFWPSAPSDAQGPASVTFGGTTYVVPTATIMQINNDLAQENGYAIYSNVQEWHCQDKTVTPPLKLVARIGAPLRVLIDTPMGEEELQSEMMIGP